MAEDSLEPLVTQCPTCRTRFRVTEVQLGVAGGRVRCGACLSVFTGLDNLVPGSGRRIQPKESADTALDALLDELRNETPPPAPPKREKMQVAPAAVPAKVAAALATPTPIAEPESEELPMPEVEMESAPVSESDAGDDDVDLDTEEFDIESDEAGLVIAEAPRDVVPAPEVEHAKPAPLPDPPKPVARDGGSKSGVKSRPVAAPVNPPPVRPVRAALDLAVDPDAMLVVPPPRRRWWVWPLLVLTVGGLAGGALYAQFDEWTMNPQIRPVYEWLCPRVGCRLAELRDIGKMESRNLVVRANPDVASGLLVDAIIVNGATFAQPFPDIQLRFSALDGTLVQKQIYHPAQYLAGELKGVKMIAPMTPVHIALDIDDPGPKAVNYVMDFVESPKP